MKYASLLPAFLLAVFPGLLFTGCGNKSAVAPTNVEATTTPPPGYQSDGVSFPLDSPKLAQIHVETVQDGDVPADQVVAPGKIELNPNRVSHVVLPVAGRIVTVSTKIGDFVKQGQPLLTVESADIDAAISSLQQAEAAQIQARAAFVKAQADMDRTKDLFEHNAIAQKEVMNSAAVLAQAKAAVDQAQAGVQQAKRRLEIFGVEPGQFGQRLTVRAPIDGKVLELTVVPGEFRNDTSTSLMTIADLSAVWVSAQVPESSIRFIQVKERLQIELSAYPGEMFTGRVMQIADTVDPQSRTIEVRAELDNRQGRLRPEMFGQIRHIDRTERSPVVPAAAIVQEEGQNFVWLQTGPGKFTKAGVKIGDRFADKQAIRSGVKAGDRVVVDGVMLLRSN